MDTIPLDVIGVIAEHCDYISRVCFSMTCRRVRRKIHLNPQTSVLMADGRLRRMFVVGCGHAYVSGTRTRRNDVTYQPRFGGPMYVYIREGDYVLEFDDAPKTHSWMYRMSRNCIVIGELHHPKLNNGRKRITQRDGYRPPLFLVRLSEQMDYQRYRGFHLQNIVDMLEHVGSIIHRAEIPRKIDRVGRVVIPSDRRREKPTDGKIPAQDL